MELEETYFFDTYALYSIVMGYPDYNKYSEQVRIATSRMNLIELHYCLLRDFGKEVADIKFEHFKRFIIGISDDVIKNANEFRYRNKKKKLSYVDCIGYVLARSRGMKFLTGDNAFKGMDGVEFVK
ncbi:MAG: PIN domain-containing protein [archaeon]